MFAIPRMGSFLGALARTARAAVAASLLLLGPAAGQAQTLSLVLDSTGDGSLHSTCDGPWDVETDPGGFTYVSCAFSENVFQILPSGQILEILSYGVNGPIYFGGYAHLAMDSARDLLLADLDQTAVVRRTLGGALSYVDFTDPLTQFWNNVLG